MGFRDVKDFNLAMLETRMEANVEPRIFMCQVLKGKFCKYTLVSELPEVCHSLRILSRVVS
jgi:hypothetical protein